jgi:hypothetical protein
MLHFAGRQAGRQAVRRTIFLFSLCMNYTEPPYSVAFFCRKLRALHRGTSLGSCVCVGLKKCESQTSSVSGNHTEPPPVLCGPDGVKQQPSSTQSNVHSI